MTAAVQGRPEDVPLRLHLVRLLLDDGRQGEAISHAAQALQYAPDDASARELVARAIGGEMGARFLSLSIVDVLNMWIGNSEKNLHEIFEAARRNAPCVLFLDEIDALGHKRSQLHSSAMRTLGNQLLAELDGMEGNNEGVLSLAATNAPWDVDAALRRPGRPERVALEP